MSAVHALDNRCQLRFFFDVSIRHVKLLPVAYIINIRRNLRSVLDVGQGGAALHTTLASAVEKFRYCASSCDFSDAPLTGAPMTIRIHEPSWLGLGDV